MRGIGRGILDDAMQGNRGLHYLRTKKPRKNHLEENEPVNKDEDGSANQKGGQKVPQRGYQVI
jgi:hypothetical protein